MIDVVCRCGRKAKAEHENNIPKKWTALILITPLKNGREEKRFIICPTCKSKISILLSKGGL